ncbi:MAG: RidA family protein [Cyanobacteria bacterium P01_D01_bin.105]
MKGSYLSPNTLPDWSTYFSQAVVIEKNDLKFIYLAGQVGVDAEKNLVGNGTFQDQLGQSFRNLNSALNISRAALSDIVKMTIYVVQYQPEQAEIIGEVIRQYFEGGQLPVMSFEWSDRLLRCICYRQ